MYGGDRLRNAGLRRQQQKGGTQSRVNVQTATTSGNRRQLRDDVGPRNNSGQHTRSCFFDYEFGNDRPHLTDSHLKLVACVPLSHMVEATTKKYVLSISERDWRTGAASLSLYVDPTTEPFLNPFLTPGLDDISNAILGSRIVQEEFRSSTNDDGSTDLRDILETRRRLRNLTAKIDEEAKPPPIRRSYAEAASATGASPKSDPESDEDNQPGTIKVETSRGTDGEWSTVIRRRRRLERHCWCRRLRRRSSRITNPTTV